MMNRIKLHIRLAWLEFTNWLFPDNVTTCHGSLDGKHTYDRYTRANGFDGCIWCGQKREKGWME